MKTRESVENLLNNKLLVYSIFIHLWLEYLPHVVNRWHSNIWLGSNTPKGNPLHPESCLCEKYRMS